MELILGLIFIYFLVEITRAANNSNTDRGERRKKEKGLSNKEKGDKGEGLAYDELKKYGYNYVVRNTYVPNGKGGYSEADLVLISSGGVYVLESKYFGGWIFEREDDNQWTQSFWAGNKKHSSRFYNPIKQNENHIIAIERYLDIHRMYFYNCSVFSDHCELKNITLNNNTNAKVFHLKDLVGNVRHNDRLKGNILTLEAQDEIYNMLLPMANRSEEFKQEHINRIKRNKGYHANKNRSNNYNKTRRS